MRDHVIDEKMAGMDRNGDGYVTLEELIDHLWPPHTREETGGKEPDWVEQERKYFGIDRDKDKVRLIVCLSVCLFVCLSVCLSVYLVFYLIVCLFVV